MNVSPHPSFQSVHVQLLITIFLAILLWALYQRLREVEFFRWWAWAWASSALFLAAAIESVRVGPNWTPLKIALLIGVLMFGMLQPLLMALGGRSWQVPGQSLRTLFRGGILLTLVLTSLAFAAGYLLRANRDASFSARNLPRTLSMWAALMSGVFCLLYAVDQVSYTIDFVVILRKYFGATQVAPNPFDHVQALLGS